jgi:threonine dehydratase
VLLVSEEEILATMKLVAQRMKIVIEPSSAVALAPLLRAGCVAGMRLGKRADGGAAKIGAIFSGGNVEMGG